MNKLVASIALSAVALTAVPAAAHDRGYYDTYHHEWVRPSRDYDYRRYDDYRRDDRWRNEHRDHDAGDVVVPLIGGLILGAIISSSNNQQSQPAPREYRYDPRCDCYRR